MCEVEKGLSQTPKVFPRLNQEPVELSLNKLYFFRLLLYGATNN